MLDPFSSWTSTALRARVARVADPAGLPTLPLHAHEVLFAVTFYTIVDQWVSPFVSRRLFPQTYPHLSPRTKIAWDIHVVSFVQSIIVNSLSLYIILCDEERSAWRGEENWDKRLWGYTGLLGLAQSLALGYFLWDFYECARYPDIYGWGMLLHAVCTCAMFISGFRPFIYFYCPVFLLHELSTPFLNIHWFCDKVGLTGSMFQAVNGALLIATFFGCRLVWGTYGSIAVFKDVYRAMTTGFTSPQYLSGKAAQVLSHGDLSDPLRQTTVFMGVRYLPFWLGATYLASNVALAILNFYWFSQMVQALRKRFDPPLGTKGTGSDKPYDWAASSKKDPKKAE